MAECELDSGTLGHPPPHTHTDIYLHHLRGVCRNISVCTRYKSGFLKSIYYYQALLFIITEIILPATEAVLRLQKHLDSQESASWERYVAFAHIPRYLVYVTKDHTKFSESDRPKISKTAAVRSTLENRSFRGYRCTLNQQPGKDKDRNWEQHDLSIEDERKYLGTLQTYWVVIPLPLRNKVAYFTLRAKGLAQTGELPASLSRVEELAKKDLTTRYADIISSRSGVEEFLANDLSWKEFLASDEGVGVKAYAYREKDVIAIYELLKLEARLPELFPAGIAVPPVDVCGRCDRFALTRLVGVGARGHFSNLQVLEEETEALVKILKTVSCKPEVAVEMQKAFQGIALTKGTRDIVGLIPSNVDELIPSKKYLVTEAEAKKIPTTQRQRGNVEHVLGRGPAEDPGMHYPSQELYSVLTGGQ